MSRIETTMLFDIGVTLKREEKFAFLLAILCSLDLDAWDWSPPAIRNRRFNSSVLAHHALFHIYITVSFSSFPACFLLTCLPSFLPFLLPSYLPFLPLFHKHLSNSQGVCTWQEYSQETQDRFISWSSQEQTGPHLRDFKAQLALALADFLRQNLEVPDLEIQNTITSSVCFTYYSKCLSYVRSTFLVWNILGWECGGKCYVNSQGEKETLFSMHENNDWFLYMRLGLWDIFENLTHWERKKTFMQNES